MNKLKAHESQLVRTRGLRRFAIGTIIAVGVGMVLNMLSQSGRMPTSFAMIPLALPGAFALQGLLEAVAGVPMTQLASQWDSLAGWQRGLLGLLVCAVALGLAGCALVLFG